MNSSSETTYFSGGAPHPPLHMLQPSTPSLFPQMAPVTHATFNDPQSGPQYEERLNLPTLNIDKNIIYRDHTNSGSPYTYVNKIIELNRERLSQGYQLTHLGLEYESENLVLVGTDKDKLSTAVQVITKMLQGPVLTMKLDADVIVGLRVFKCIKTDFSAKTGCWMHFIWVRRTVACYGLDGHGAEEYLTTVLNNLRQATATSNAGRGPGKGYLLMERMYGRRMAKFIKRNVDEIERQSGALLAIKSDSLASLSIVVQFYGLTPDVVAACALLDEYACSAGAGGDIGMGGSSNPALGRMGHHHFASSPAAGSPAPFPPTGIPPSCSYNTDLSMLSAQAGNFSPRLAPASEFPRSATVPSFSDYPLNMMMYGGTPNTGAGPTSGVGGMAGGPGRPFQSFQRVQSQSNTSSMGSSTSPSIPSPGFSPMASGAPFGGFNLHPMGMTGSSAAPFGGSGGAHRLGQSSIAVPVGGAGGSMGLMGGAQGTLPTPPAGPRMPQSGSTVSFSDTFQQSTTSVGIPESMSDLSLCHCPYTSRSEMDPATGDIVTVCGVQPGTSLAETAAATSTSAEKPPQNKAPITATSTVTNGSSLAAPTPSKAPSIQSPSAPTPFQPSASESPATNSPSSGLAAPGPQTTTAIHSVILSSPSSSSSSALVGGVIVDGAKPTEGVGVVANGTPSAAQMNAVLLAALGTEASFAKLIELLETIQHSGMSTQQVIDWLAKSSGSHGLTSGFQ